MAEFSGREAELHQDDDSALLIDLVRYVIVRVRYNTIRSHQGGPCRMKVEKRKRIPERLTLALFFS